jgi:hypothetical protein
MARFECKQLHLSTQKSHDEQKERIRQREWRVNKTLAEHHRHMLEHA